MSILKIANVLLYTLAATLLIFSVFCGFFFAATGESFIAEGIGWRLVAFFISWFGVAVGLAWIDDLKRKLF